MTLKTTEHYSESINSTIVTVYDCSVCSLPICDQSVFRVNEKYFHLLCLNCSECQMKLIDKCYTQDGNIYCKEDFFKKFGTKCSSCGYNISSTDFIQRANNFIYHLQCFSCLICHCQLNTGDEFYLINNQKLLCKIDHNLLKTKEYDEANRRLRTTITQNQLDILKQTYNINSKPARYIRESLAIETGLDMRVVQVWFQNRRAKEKRLKINSNKRCSNVIHTKSTNKCRKTRNIHQEEEEEEINNEYDTIISFDEISEHDSSDSIYPQRQYSSFNELLSFNST